MELSPSLQYVPSLDSRPVQEVLDSLSAFQPITSEKNIWAFWHSGLASLPPWCRRNVTDWIQLNGSDWKVRILDDIPDSPNNVARYIPENMLPEIFRKKAMTGPFVGQHSADLIRGACLYLHGGVWMDVGILLFRQLDGIWNDLLQNEKDMCVMHMGGTGISNHFIAARRQSPLVKHWHDLFAYLWKDRTDCSGLSAHPLLLPVLESGNKFHGDEATNHFGWEHVCSPDKIMDYGAHILVWQRLVMLQSDEFDGVDYFMDKVLLLDVVNEAWRGEKLFGWKGSDLFDALNSPVDPASPAFKMVMTLLAQACMQKVYRGKEMLKYPALGVLWDDHEGADCQEGTLAGLLRHGSVHFEQKRQLVYVANPRPVVLHKGVYEV
ncbi:hypothetical protein ASPZODRAFT_70396 [Penicilliopsis zonata CBS 506.65]|uniref:Capsule polysaccharide biosynthesis protein n=1 Tax=Penicilliopsis zonata CBS 506.65 TaxID=1073090 RepID=A0A1L9SCT5_9EURO|nr:hypothetical protein ASPZODRAFT_70396 [Penicilliopsis zonata CBS 506.65]OJJ45030.1 hypothetical protein ASPZODRAFT_70396 [Penicilliopsis zonata CBS 506.65]